MPLLQKGWVIWLLPIMLFVACKKETSCEACDEARTEPGNKPPVANAGTDQTISILSKEFILNGELSTDPNKNITGYLWTRISGSSDVRIANANAVKTGVTKFVQGVFLFELKVTDSNGLFSRDTVTIFVNNFDDPTGRWTSLYGLPTNHFFYGSNHINFLIGIQNSVYAVSKIGTFWKYNPQTNLWSKKADLPTGPASSNFSVVFSINNIGYVVGNGTSRQYNADTDKWTAKINTPVGDNHVDYSVPLVIGNKAYLVGSTNNKVTLYDPATDTYTLKAGFADEGAETGFVINGEGYCIQKDGRCWKYNPLTDGWSQKASLPPSIYNKSGFSLNGYGYIIGDLERNAYNQSGQMKVWRYNVSTNQWKQLDENYPGQAAYEVRTVSLNGIVYAGLGYTRENKDAVDFWSFK